jgi:hypothetical protein
VTVLILRLSAVFCWINGFRGDTQKRPFSSTDRPECRTLGQDTVKVEAIAMLQTEFNHLLSTVGTLSPEQLQALRREVDSKLALCHASAAPTGEEAFKRQLLKSGLMTSLPTPSAPGSRPAFEPVALDGEPLSETIIRERR